MVPEMTCPAEERLKISFGKAELFRGTNSYAQAWPVGGPGHFAQGVSGL